MSLVIGGLYVHSARFCITLVTFCIQVKETIPSLAELGGHQLYPADPSVGTPPLVLDHNLAFIALNLDRRPALLAILRSILASYYALTSSLLLPPPPNPSIQPEWQRHVEWITVLSQNIMAAVNDLRPVQVSSTVQMLPHTYTSKRGSRKP